MYLLRKAARKLHGRLNFRGLEISVENRMGSIREWKNSHDGTEGMTRMRHAYGYFKGTIGCDQDAVDVFVGPNREAPNVYIVDQMKAPDFTEFDEQKVLVGFLTQDDARKFYLAHYDDPRFFGRIAELSFEEFREKVMKTRGNGGKPIVKAIDRLAERVRAALRKSQMGFDFANGHDHHVGYTRTNASGTVSQIKAKGSPHTIYHAGANVPTHTLNSDAYWTHEKDVAEKGYLHSRPEVDTLHTAEFHGDNPATDDVVLSTAKRLGFDEDDIEMYTPATIFDKNVFPPRLVDKLKKELAKKGYSHIEATDITPPGDYQKEFKAIIPLVPVTATVRKSEPVTARRYRPGMSGVMQEMLQPMMTLFDKLVVDSDFKPFIREAGGDPSQIDMAEFRRGYKIEMEHKDVTGGDPVLTAKIVLAHLKENARYYSLLEKYVEKAVPGIHLLRKSHIRSYQRRTAKGQTIRVQEHTNTVQKKIPQRREARQPRQENKTAENFVARINERFPNISISLTGATEQTITPTLKQFLTLADRYPLAARSLSAITTLTEEYDVFPSQRPALIGVIGGKTVIALNPKFYGDEKHLFDHLDNERVKKELLPLISILYPITHEFGHLLYRQINTNYSNAAEKWATENRSKWHHTKVARANIREAFAEGFSEIMLYQKTGLSRYAKGLKMFLEGYHGEK
jgi:hypothetical protein